MIILYKLKIMIDKNNIVYHLIPFEYMLDTSMHEEMIRPIVMESMQRQYIF
jgi:hypothetical protein